MMKYLKALLVVIITLFAFGSAIAQPVKHHNRIRRHWHHRHWHHHPHH